MALNSLFADLVQEVEKAMDSGEGIGGRHWTDYGDLFFISYSGNLAFSYDL